MPACPACLVAPELDLMHRTEERFTYGYATGTTYSADPGASHQQHGDGDCSGRITSMGRTHETRPRSFPWNQRHIRPVRGFHYDHHGILGAIGWKPKRNEP